jgi:YggT family protein
LSVRSTDFTAQNPDSIFLINRSKIEADRIRVSLHSVDGPDTTKEDNVHYRDKILFIKMATFSSKLASLIFVLFLSAAAAFSPAARPSLTRPTVLGAFVDPNALVDFATTFDSSLILAETEAWVAPAASFLEPFLNFLSFAMLVRIVLSWYPTKKITDFPWIVVVLPTEPLLRAAKGFIPPAFGVDITPVVWLGFFTFVHEILLGQQGLLTMKIKYGI